MPRLPWGERLTSLRWRLMLLTAGSMLATLVLLGVYMAGAQTALARAGISSTASASARSIALGSANSILTQQLDEVEELLLRSAEFSDILSAAVFEASGAPLAQVARRDGGSSLRPVYAQAGQRQQLPAGDKPMVVEDADGTRLVAWQPVVAGSLLGWVRVEHGMESLASIRAGIWRGTLAACALALAGSLLLLHALLRGPMRAVERARDFASDLERANGRQLSDEVQVREVRDLVQALNGASSKLFAQRMAIVENLDRLSLQEAALADRNEHLAMLFALSPDGIVSMDRDGHIRFANPAFAHMLGLEPQDIVGQSQSWLDDLLHTCCDPAWGWAPLEELFDPLHEGTPHRRAVSLKRPRALELLLVGVCGHAKSARRLLYVRDVTHETEVDRLKSEFLTTAAHELRTPMASIHGFTELLLMREFDASRRNGMLQRIHHNSTAMIHIVNELLDLARIEARRGVDFEFVRADLRDVAAAAVAAFAVPQGREAPVLLPGDSPVPVRADREKLGRVLHNLLSNAYKYSAPASGVTVAVLSQQAQAGLEVTDRGIGMTAEQLPRVCERFYRADPSGNVLGTGLGMSIAKEIVELHGGRLDLRSQPGQGTTVTVWLEMAQGPQDEAPAPASTGEARVPCLQE